MERTDCLGGHVHTNGPLRRQWAAFLLESAFVVIALFILLLGRVSDYGPTLSITFFSIVLEALPFIMIGAIASGAIEVFVPKERLIAILPKRRFLSVLMAGTLGIFLPVCECAIVPIVRRLLRKGFPQGAAVTYLLAGPIVNPVVAMSTAVAFSFSWRVAAIRLLCGFIVSVTVGLIIDRVSQDKRFSLLPNDEPHEAGCSCAHTDEHIHHASESPLRRLAATCVHDFFDVAKFLIIGAFIAAVIQTAIPREQILTLTSNPLLSILLMMGLAVLFSLCSEADAFVAAPFRYHLGFPAQMAFLVLGPMFDLKLLLMYLGSFRRLTAVLIIGLTILIVFTLMLLLLAIYGSAPT